MNNGRLIFYTASNGYPNICTAIRSFTRLRFEKKNKVQVKVNWLNPTVSEVSKFNHPEISTSNSTILCTRKKVCESNIRVFNDRSVVTIPEKRIVRSYGTSSATTSPTVISEMPEARGLPLVGTTLSLIRAGGASKLHEYVDKRHNELGPIYRERIGSVKAVFVSSPDQYRRIFRLEGPRPKHLLPEAWILYNEMRKCQRGLFFMEGDEWLNFRRIMNKLLLKPESDKFMIGPCKDAAKTLVTHCNSFAKRGTIIPELEKKLYQWSIEVMLAILVGSTWSNHRSKILLKTEKLAGNLHKIFYYSGQLSLLPVRLAMNLRLPLWNKFVNSVDNALQIVTELVEEIIVIEGADGLIKMFTGEGIHGNDLIRIVADLILAAGDTTAYSMQWGLFLLANHPEVQEELFENLKTLNEEEMTQNPLLKSVMKEALRLYPTAPFLTRFLPEDSNVGGYRVEKGELILMSLYTSGRDDKNFKKASNFSPERWLRNERGDYNGVINPHASLPFALGARSCIGRKIAEVQLTLTMGEIIKNLNMKCLNKDNVKMILNLVSVPSEPIKLLMTPRGYNPNDK